MSEYVPRIADDQLRASLGAVGAVLIEGPKACGKTSTAIQQAASVIRLDEDTNARAATVAAPELLFERPAPILFDEWQIEPRIWNLVRRHVDDRQQRGQFILTGSATPRDDAQRHTGAGRFSVLPMRPMSLYESKHSTGQVSLATLLAGEPQHAQQGPLDVPALAERIVIGGWPALLNASTTQAQRWLRDYLRNVVEVDIPALGHRRSPRNLNRLLRSLARSVGQAPKLAGLHKDVSGDAGTPALETVDRYLEALDRLMLVENSEAWPTHMRSATRLRTAPVRYFIDPSLATAALGVGPTQLLNDLNAMGFHFEALVVRDLRIYAQPLDGQVYSWRDANGNEVDAIVSTFDGRWAAFEAKLNPDDVDAAAAALLRFADKVDTSRIGEPAALSVITGTGYAYRRPDGISVVPISALGP